MLPQQYCLRWKYHHSNLQKMFSQLLDRGCFCDVTLACEGQLIRAHRVVLCACSTFFDTVLTNYASERDPIVIMKDVTFADVKCLIEFMYKGEINVEHAHLASLLKTADDLKIKGLAEVSWRDDDDGLPPPGPTTEYLSPRCSGAGAVHDLSYGQHDPVQPQRGTCSPAPALVASAELGAATSNVKTENGWRRSPSPAPTPAQAVRAMRMPTLTPLPNTSIVATAPPDYFLGPKRKRGRPPLDDAYDVFNVRKLGHYDAAAQHDPQAAAVAAAYQESQKYTGDSPCEDIHHATANVSATTPASVAAVAAAYQHHIQQQQQQLAQLQQHNKQRMRQRHRQQQRQQQETAEKQDGGNGGPVDPEWINSTLEVNVSGDLASGKTLADASESQRPWEKDVSPKRNSEKKGREKTPDKTKETRGQFKGVSRTRSSSKEEAESASPQGSQTNRSLLTEVEDDGRQSNRENLVEPEQTRHPAVPQTVEEMGSGDQPDTGSSRRSSLSPTGVTIPQVPPPPPLLHSHFSKYAAEEGYLLNEHGLLMASHEFVNAATASSATSAAGAAGSLSSSCSTTSATATGAANGSDNDMADIKMEDYDVADLRLTCEEMSQWQDVIKMDDYLAKGRRPQFWEEPFTRRVLDAIKSKRLEMKKAARILGVSYGTLYGRYREVYGCLKHPYSSGNFRNSQASQLTAQTRFDIVWPSPKREGTGSVLPSTQLEIGKIRPKDMSELWARPQI